MQSSTYGLVSAKACLNMSFPKPLGDCISCKKAGTCRLPGCQVREAFGSSLRRQGQRTVLANTPKICCESCGVWIVFSEVEVVFGRSKFDQSSGSRICLRCEGRSFVRMYIQLGVLGARAQTALMLAAAARASQSFITCSCLLSDHLSICHGGILHIARQGHLVASSPEFLSGRLRQSLHRI